MLLGLVCGLGAERLRRRFHICKERRSELPRVWTNYIPPRRAARQPSALLGTLHATGLPTVKMDMSASIEFAVITLSHLLALSCPDPSPGETEAPVTWQDGSNGARSPSCSWMALPSRGGDWGMRVWTALYSPGGFWCWSFCCPSVLQPRSSTRSLAQAAHAHAGGRYCFVPALT